MHSDARQAEGDRAEIVGIIGCGSAKEDEPTEAQDLYSSNYFALKREYVETFCDRWLILSAEHGLIRPYDVIEPYETTVTDEDFDRAAYVDELAFDLEWSPGLLNYATEVVVLAGSDYAELLRDAFRRQREFVGNTKTPLEETVDVEYLFQELSFAGNGEQMGYLREAIDENMREPGDGWNGQTDLSRFEGRTAIATDGGVVRDE